MQKSSKLRARGLRNYVELRPSWEAASCADTQELPNILWNPEVHYHVHKSPSLVPILSQINPVHTTRSYLSKIHFNITFPLRLGLPSGLFPFGFPTKTIIVTGCYKICIKIPINL
jgi:hypothetical protein